MDNIRNDDTKRVISEETKENLITGCCVSVALFLVYLTAPALITFVGTIIGENLKFSLWEPVLSAAQGNSLFGFIFLGWALLTMVNRARHAGRNGDSLVPAWVIALAVGVLILTAYLVFAMLVFGATTASLLSLDLHSGLATLVGLIFTLLALYVVR